MPSALISDPNRRLLADAILFEDVIALILHPNPMVRWCGTIGRYSPVQCLSEIQPNTCWSNAGLFTWFGGKLQIMIGGPRSIIRLCKKHYHWQLKLRFAGFIPF